MAETEKGALQRDSFVTLVATAVAYGILLAVLAAAMFGVPYLIFRALG